MQHFWRKKLKRSTQLCAFLNEKIFTQFRDALHFVEQESSLPCSGKAKSFPSSEWDNSSPYTTVKIHINPLKPELNPICYLLALLKAHHFLHVNVIRVKSLTFRRLMSYIYGAPILDVSRSHTMTQHSR